MEEEEDVEEPKMSQEAFPKVFHRTEVSFGKKVEAPKTDFGVGKVKEGGSNEFIDKDALKKENKSKIECMSIEEIKEAQKEILSKLNPQVLKKLQGLSKEGKSTQKNMPKQKERGMLQEFIKK